MKIWTRNVVVNGCYYYLIFAAAVRHRLVRDSVSLPLEHDAKIVDSVLLHLQSAEVRMVASRDSWTKTRSNILISLNSWPMHCYIQFSQ